MWRVWSPSRHRDKKPRKTLMRTWRESRHQGRWRLEGTDDLRGQTSRLEVPLEIYCWWRKVLAAKLCLALRAHGLYSPPGSSVHGIIQARILEWVAISFSRGSSPLRDQTQVSCTAGRFFTVWATREALSRTVTPLIMLYRLQSDPRELISLFGSSKERTFLNTQMCPAEFCWWLTEDIVLHTQRIASKTCMQEFGSSGMLLASEEVCVSTQHMSMKADPT